MSDLRRLLGLAGTLRVDEIDSPALRHNPLGDPSRRVLPIYTPPGYDPHGTRSYPVLYCLHGYTGDAAAMVAARPWERNVVQWADQLISSGAMPPVILALVDGFTRLGGSQYVDSIHNGDYATYVARDVIAHLDATYRTVAHTGGRAVFGKSSGGFGALHLVMSHPDRFAAVGSHSGDTYFRGTHPAAWPTVQRTLERFVDIAAFVADFERRDKRSGGDYATMEMLGYAAAYSPRAAEPFAFDLPFDLKTGEQRDEVFARWIAFDPVERVENAIEALRALRHCYVDCGRRDEYGLDIGARILVNRMRACGLHVQHEEFDDDHRGIAYRYRESLPALARVLDRE